MAYHTKTAAVQAAQHEADRDQEAMFVYRTGRVWHVSRIHAVPKDGTLFYTVHSAQFIVSRSEFIAQYIETALWSSSDQVNEQGGEPLDANYGIEDIEPESLRTMIADCVTFQNVNVADLARHGDYGQAGHDFWLTRNHHGAGFWDRGLGALGHRLTDAAHAYGEQDIYVGDDGRLYV